LRRAEFDECQRAAAEMIRKFGKVTALIVLDGFRVGSKERIGRREFPARA
jgi:hypothetical protein